MFDGNQPRNIIPIDSSAEMAALFVRLSPPLQRACIALARHAAGCSCVADATNAYSRAGDLLTLSGESERLADWLLELAPDET